MRVMIPDIGDTYVLAQDWEFTLHNEYRNDDVRDALGLKDTEPYKSLRARYDREKGAVAWDLRYVAQRQLQEITWRVTLPAGTKLRVDRVYIRKGAADFSSLSFYVEECPLPALTPSKQGGGFKKGRRRFWAKLADVNTMEIV